MQKSHKTKFYHFDRTFIIYYQNGNSFVLRKKSENKMANEKTNNNTFLLSDESVNSYGLIVKTEGINLQRFIKNPVMLYSHCTEGGNIGIWQNIRTINNTLYADAVFYEKNEKAKEIKEKVESGFLRGCSISIDVLETKGNVITKSVLLEVSICEIPSNENALKLYYHEKKVDDFKGLLSLQLQEQTKDFYNRFASITGVNIEGFDLNKLLQAFETKTQEEKLKNACSKGIIKADEIKPLLCLYKESKQEFEKILIDRTENEKAKVLLLLNNAFGDGLIIDNNLRQIILKIGDNMGYSICQELVKTLPKRVSLSQLIKNAQPTQKRGLDWYRKNAPDELKKNPSLFQRLLDEEYRKNAN